MDMIAILYAVGVFLAVILLLVVILLVAKRYLVASGRDVINLVAVDGDFNIAGSHEITFRHEQYNNEEQNNG